MKLITFLILGIIAGSFTTIQSVLNASLGKRTGNLGSVFLLTLISILFLAVVILLIPGTANLKAIPGPKEWYLYAGGVLGVAIVAAPILLIPRIGATSTLTALVVGSWRWLCWWITLGCCPTRASKPTCHGWLGCFCWWPVRS